MNLSLSQIDVERFVYRLAATLSVLVVVALGWSPARAAAPIAVQDSDISGVEIALLEVKRTSGDTLTVRWEYRNKGDKQRELEKVGLNEADHFKLAGAAYLVDAGNKKKYLVVRDQNGTPLGSRATNFRVPPNDTLSIWAKFPAPPASVQKISVYAPHSAPFDDVPIGK
jgi:hypothetical protein